MQDNLHHKSVEERLKDFTMDPSEPVWANIEENLDKKKRRYIIGWWMLLPLLLIGTGLFLFTGNNTKQKRGDYDKQQSSGKNTKEPTNTTAGNTATTIPVKKNDIAGNTAETAVMPEKVTKTQKSKTANFDFSGVSSPGYNKKTKKVVTGKKTPENPGDDVFTSSTDPVTDKGRMTTKIESPQPSGTDSTNALQKDTDSSAGNKLLSSQKLPVDNTDTVKTTSEKLKDKNKPQKRWQMEWTANAGAAELGGLNFFSKQEVFQYSTGGIGSSPAIRTVQQHEIMPGISAGVGIQLAKKLSPYFTFRTGIGYQYRSMTIKQTLTTDSLVAGTSADFYTTLSIVSSKSSLHLHHINIPLLLTYSFPKGKISMTGGLQNHFVVAGNWNEHASLLGKKKLYMPSVYLNPAVAFRNFNAGPYLNIGLQRFEGNKRLMEYGISIRAPF